MFRLIRPTVNSGCERALAAADEGLGARQQFAQVEWLGQVVVGPGVEQLDDLRRLVARGEDQDGRHVLAAAHLAHDAQSIQSRQHQVQQQQVVVLELGHRSAVRAIFGAVHREAAALAQRFGDVVGQPDFVFHNQHSHQDSIYSYTSALIFA